MFAQDLHKFLAVLSLVALAVVTVEAGVRAARALAPGRWVVRIANIMVLLVALTAVGGVALLIRGHRPHEMLHLIYAVLVLGAVPVADSLARSRGARGQAMARVLGALVGLGLAVRVFATG
jgi:uncharacterized membrane protein